MKDWKDLSKMELAEMDSETVQRTEYLILAEAGVKIPVKPVLQDVPADPYEELEQETYPVCRGIIFENEEDAISFSKMSVMREEYKSSYSHKYVEDETLKTMYTSNELKYQKYYIKDDIIEADRDGKLRDKILKQNKELSETYQSELESLDETLNEFKEALRYAVNLKHKVEGIILQMETYLNLSNGDFEIAVGFLKKAYGTGEAVEIAIEQYKNKQDEK